MDWYVIFLILHLFGVAIGAGAAFFSDFLFIRAILTKKRVDTTTCNTLHFSGNIVFAGLALLIVSGIAMVWINDFALLESTKFLAKLTIVGLLTINGVAFHAYHLPYLKKLAAKGTELFDRTNSKQRIDLLFASGALSSVSWISVIILGTLSAVPMTYPTILSLYFIALSIALVGAFNVRRLGILNLPVLPTKTTKNTAHTLGKAGLVLSLVLGVIFIIVAIVSGYNLHS